LGPDPRCPAQGPGLDGIGAVLSVHHSQSSIVTGFLDLSTPRCAKPWSFQTEAADHLAL
jgi:hypothetical protein